MIDKIKCNKRIGNDIHKELIALFKKLQEGWIPPEHISEDEYNKVNKNKGDYPDWYVGFIGFCATFGSKYFGGYARGFKEDKVTPRDIPNEAIRNLMSQVPDIKDVEFVNEDYLTLDETKLHNCVIYCDPPYQDTTKYVTGGFEYDVFWQWVRDTSKDNFVLVSEYNAPKDFICIWSKAVTTSLKVHEHENRIERLFVHNSGKYAKKYDIINTY
jgi:DNA adenine methylase